MFLERDSLRLHRWEVHEFNSDGNGIGGYVLESTTCDQVFAFDYMMGVASVPRRGENSRVILATIWGIF